MAGANDRELFRAAELLFGRGGVPRSLAGESWWRALRAAFRRRALESHPDRASILHRSEAELASDFKRVCEAYQLLGVLAAAPPDPDPRPRPPAARPGAVPEQEVPASRPDHLHEGPLPARPLRFGEYLYYSGRISFWNMVEAVSRQQRQRPPVGRIAVERGHLRPEQVLRILAARRREGAEEPFGAYALRLGLLTEPQLDGILERQHLLQRRIGECLIEMGVLAEYEVQAARRDMQRHNAQWRG